MQRDRAFALRARASPLRAHAAVSVAAAALADIPVSCFYTFCDMLLPDTSVVCVSRDTVAVIQPGAMGDGNRIDHAMDHGGDIVDVAAAASHLVVGRGMGFQTTTADVITGRLTTHYMGDTHASQVIAVDITPAGIVATSCAEGTIYIWDQSTYAPAPSRRSAPMELVGHTDWVRHVKFTVAKYGRLLLVSAGDDGKVCVWDPLCASCLHTTQFYPHSLRCAAAMSTGKGSPLIAVAANTSIGLYEWQSNLFSGRLVEHLRITSHDAPVTTIALGENIVCSACEDEVVNVHEASAPGALLVSCRARLATRLCASLMTCLTKMVVLAAPPTSSAIVIACCSSDGDFIVIAARPNDPPDSLTYAERSRLLSPAGSPNLALRSMIESASSALSSVWQSTRSSQSGKTQMPRAAHSDAFPGTTVGTPKYSAQERSTMMTTGSVVGMAICHVAFS